MVGAQTMIVAIGVGCRRECAAEAIEALVREALGHVPDATPLGLFTIADKQGHAGLADAASRLGIDLVFLPRAALRDQAPLVRTHSPRSKSRFGVPSVAEAAALAGVGGGATILVPRIAQGGATCAVAGRAVSDTARPDRAIALSIALMPMARSSRAMTARRRRAMTARGRRAMTILEHCP
jgi:cobalt-precorrin 5A hydrolase